MRKEIKFTHQEKRKLFMITLTVTLSISALFIGRAVQKTTYNQHTYPLSTVIECVKADMSYRETSWTFAERLQMDMMKVT